MTAIKGGKVAVEMNKRVLCGECKGTKAVRGSKPRKCFECGGRGSVIGNYGIRKRCMKCNGAGCIVREPCHTCEGLGVQRQTVTEEIELPPGAVDGQKLRVRGFGHSSDVFMGAPGDLLLTLKILLHDTFERVGESDVGSTIELSIGQAIFGGKVTIETLEGHKSIVVPAGVKDGE